MASPRLKAISALLIGFVLALIVTPALQRAADRVKVFPQQWARLQSIKDFESKELSADFVIEEIVSGLEVPWDITWDPSGRMFVVDRPGQVYLVDAVSGTKQLYHTFDDVLQNKHTLHSGLWDIEFHPDFEANRFVYFLEAFRDTKLLPSDDPAYSIDSGDWGLRNKIVRYRDVDNQLVFDRIIFVSSHGHRTRSSGGRLKFGPDRKLYVATGFATTWSAPQDLQDTLGKMLRLNDDGRVPSDNPFVGKANVDPKIWTYGHKNIYGFDWLLDSNQIISIEHGPTQEHVDAHGFDEINYLHAGANYGFPKVWGDWKLSGAESPIHFWPFPHPPGDLIVYKGSAFPSWKAQLFISNMANSILHRLRLENDQVTEDEIILQWLPDTWSPLDRLEGERHRTRIGRIRGLRKVLMVSFTSLLIDGDLGKRQTLSIA